MKKLTVTISLTVILSLSWISNINALTREYKYLSQVKINQQTELNIVTQNLNLSQLGEERKIIIISKDENSTTQSWAEVEVFSIDGNDIIGPFTVYEGTPELIDIDEREWEVRVLNKSLGSTVSWNIE